MDPGGGRYFIYRPPPGWLRHRVPAVACVLPSRSPFRRRRRVGSSARTPAVRRAPLWSCSSPRLRANGLTETEPPPPVRLRGDLFFSDTDEQALFSAACAFTERTARAVPCSGSVRRWRRRGSRRAFPPADYPVQGLLSPYSDNGFNGCTEMSEKHDGDGWPSVFLGLLLCRKRSLGVRSGTLPLAQG